MENLEILNQDKTLEVKIWLDKNYIYANQINFDFYDKNKELSKRHSAHSVEVYFEFNKENEKQSSLNAKDLFNVLKDFKENIDLTFFCGLDNWEIDRYQIKDYAEKVVLEIHLDNMGLEIDDNIENIFEVAEMFYDKDTQEVVNFIYEDFKEEIYRTYNVKTKGDFLALLDEATDDLVIDTISFIESKVRKLPYNEQLAFCKKYLK